MVSAWRFAVGDYLSETSGGGVSSATISGGSLTTYELDIAFSDNQSSSGSNFNISGGSVAVHGDVVVGEFGNTATLTMSGGTLTIDGDLREGFNDTNTSNFRMDGGSSTWAADRSMPGRLAIARLHHHRQFCLQRRDDPQRQHRADRHRPGRGGRCDVFGDDVWQRFHRPGPGRGSATTLTIPAGVRMAASSSVELWPGGTLALGSGAAIAIGTTPSFTTNQINLLSGGTLAGDGAVAAALDNIGGTIAPGHDANGGTIGTLTVAANFTQGSAGVTRIKLAAAGNDQLQSPAAPRWPEHCA